MQKSDYVNKGTNPASRKEIDRVMRKLPRHAIEPEGIHNRPEGSPCAEAYMSPSSDWIQVYPTYGWGLCARSVCGEDSEVRVSFADEDWAVIMIGKESKRDVVHVHYRYVSKPTKK